jgi:preprotein translocase subunit SecE
LGVRVPSGLCFYFSFLVEFEIMEQKKESRGLDKFYWLLSCLLIAAGIAAHYYFSLLPWPIKLAGWIVLGCVICLILFQTTTGKKFFHFAKDARIELYKVVWPTKQETIHTTMLLVVLVIVMSLIMWGMDSLLLKAVSWITG